MVILIEPKKYQWLDRKHTVFMCKVKEPVDGWIYITCHQHSDGIGKTLWESRRCIDILPYEIEQQEYIHKMEHSNDIQSE